MTVLTGGAIEWYRVKVLIAGYKLELKGMHKRGRSCKVILQELLSTNAKGEELLGLAIEHAEALRLKLGPKDIQVI